MDSKAQYDGMLREKPTDFLSEAPDHFLLNKKDLFLIGAHPFSEATRRRMMKEGRFPSRVSLGPRSIGWFEEDVQTFLTSLRENTSAK